MRIPAVAQRPAQHAFVFARRKATIRNSVSTRIRDRIIGLRISIRRNRQTLLPNRQRTIDERNIVIIARQTFRCDRVTTHVLCSLRIPAVAQRPAQHAFVFARHKATIRNSVSTRIRDRIIGLRISIRCNLQSLRIYRQITVHISELVLASVHGSGRIRRNGPWRSGSVYIVVPGSAQRGIRRECNVADRIPRLKRGHGELRTIKRSAISQCLILRGNGYDLLYRKINRSFRSPNVACIIRHFKCHGMISKRRHRQRIGRIPCRTINLRRCINPGPWNIGRVSSHLHGSNIPSGAQL